MAQTIVVPGGDRLEFPDGMSDADIEKAIFAEYPDLAPKPGVFDRIKSALTPSADRAPMPSTSETINAPSSEFDTGATAATEGAISMPGSVMDGYVPRESDQGVSADSGMGPMRQSYYDETRAGLLSAPIQSHAAAAQAGGQVGKVARDTLPQRLDKAGRELSGDILPKNRQELTDDIQAGRYREDEIGSMSDPDAGLSEFGKAVKFGFSAAGDSANPLIRGAGQGVAGFGQWAAGLGEIIGDMTGNGDLVISAQDMRRRWKSFENEATGQGQFRKMADVTQAKDSGAKWLEEGVQNAANSITRQLPGLLTGSTGPALTMMFMDSLGTEYGIAKAAGRPADEALSRAALFAGFEVAGEKLALDYMMPRLRDMARGVSTEKLPQFFAGLISREVPGELFTHGGQSAVDATKALGLRPDMTLEQYFAEIPAVVRDTIIQSGLMAGSGSAMNAGIRAVRSSTDDLTAGRDFIQASIDAAARQSLDPANAQLFRSGGLLSTPIVPRATPADVAAAETPEAAAAAIADIGAGIAGSVPITEALAATQAEIDALLSEPIESAALPQTPIPVPPMAQPGAVAADLRQPQVDSLSTSPTPIVNATPEGGAKSLGFVEAFASLQGGGITEKLYAQAFDALQNGKTTIAGIRDPLLQRAKAAFDAGLIKSPADIRGFEQGGYPSIPNPSPAPIVTQQSDNAVPPGLAQMRARVAERQSGADAPAVKESLTTSPGIVAYSDGQKYHQKIPEVSRIRVAPLRRMNESEVASVSDDVAASMDFSEPIKVSVFADGDLRIVDGHHRVAAAKKRGIDFLPVELQAINARGERIRRLIADQGAVSAGAGPSTATSEAPTNLSAIGSEISTPSASGQPQVDVAAVDTSSQRVDESAKTEQVAPSRSITRTKGGKLDIAGFSREEVADTLKTAKITATVTAGKDGRVLVSATDRAGNAVKISIKQQNAINRALMGAPTTPKKARKLSGNLKNDLDIIAPGLYGEVSRGGDGEANDAAWGDVSLIAEKMRDEQGYMLPHDANGQDLANSLRELIRQHAGGDVVLNEARQAAAMTEEETKRHRSDVLRLADEYGIETKRGIIPRRLEDIEAELEQAIEHEIGISGRSAVAAYESAIAAGFTEAEADAILDKINEGYNGDTSRDAWVRQYRDQANALQEAIDAQEREGRAPKAENAAEAPSQAEERPTLELAGQTEAEAQAELDRRKAIADQERAEAAEAARKERAARDKAEKDRRAAAVIAEDKARRDAEIAKLQNPDDFQFGADAPAAPAPVIKKVSTEQARGQGNMFDAPAIDAAANQAATSPTNDTPPPTPAQMEAGNYAKGHVRLHGFDISIENPKGSERVAKDGSWRVPSMPAHYGYIKGAIGADKEHLDVFIGPNPESTTAWVINQVVPDSSPARFDEHKVMLGFNSADDAKGAYLLSFEGTFGAKVFGSMTEALTIDQLKAKIEDGELSRKKFVGPVAADATGKRESEEQPAAPVAESNASPMERDDAGVTPGQDGAAAERKTDAKGNPIYKMGERVEYISGGYKGRHGAISQVMPITMRTVMVFSGAASQSETTYYYHVKTDNGADFMANPEEIRGETEKPASVVPDITVDGMVQEPRRVFDGIGYAKRSAEGARAAAQRARKASSIADHKRTAERNDAKAAEYQAAWDAWAEQYPEEAEKIAPKPAPKGLPAAKVPVSGDALKDVGLTVTKTTTKNGKPVWEVGGNTKEHSDMLKRIGGRWYGPKKVWSFYNDDPTAAISEKLGGIKPAEAVIELAENEVRLPDSPYVYRKEQNGWTWRVAGGKFSAATANNLAPKAPIIDQLEAELARKNPKIMGRPVIEVTDTTLENLADQESAAGEKARAELEARDQADEVDLGALFDEVLAEETGQADNTATSNRLKLLRYAKNIGVQVMESDGHFHASDGMVEIPYEDSLVDGAQSADHVLAHELGHAAMQNRGISYSGFPATELRKQISNWDELIAASRNFRPGVWDHSTKRIADHARKPNEIISDAIASVLIGENDFSLLRGLPLTERDIGITGEPKTPAQPRTAGQAAASAAINAGKGLADAIDGLGKLFGSNGSRLSMGVSFDEDTYAKAKPLFAQAVAHFKDAGADLKEAMRAVVRLVLDKFGPQVTENMKPYIVRFMEDVKAGNVVYDESTEAVENGSERGKDTAHGSGNQGSGDRIYGSPGQADQEGLGGTAPEDVGAAGEAGASGRPGAGTPDSDVGSRRPVSEGGNVANGRPGAGGTGVADAGAGGRGRSGGQSVVGTDGGNQPGPRPAEGSRAEVGNYHISDPEQLIGGTPKVRFARNRKAIEALQAIQSEGRQPTPDELDAMAGYIGWGSFGQELFQGTHDRPKPKAGWEKESDWLREHLGQEAWESAQASIINAHYTDPITVSTMWDMVRQMGFTGGRVLEPSMGVGNFFGLMPRDLMARSKLAGIEMDTTTGGMAQLLYPDANIQIKPYQDSKTADNFYDLVIGNWPFAKDGPADRRYLKLSPSLHDFFFLKALDQTRPGGLVVGITSAGTMDKQGSLTRAALAEKADLVAAFRLPTGAFEKYAGTSVVTDIIILKKRETPNADVRSSGWLTTVEVDTPSGNKVKVNEYYASNPGKVLGTLNFGHGTTYGRPAMIVDRPADLESRMGELAATLPEGVFEPATTKAKTIQYVTNNTKDRQQSIVAQDGKMYQVRGEYLAPLHEIHEYRVKDAKKNADREAQLGKLIDMRRKHGALIDAERDGLDDIETRRKALNDAYKAFTKAHGPLADSEGMAIMRRVGDPFFPSLAALEVDGKPATILSRATMRTKKKLENPSVRDALIMMRNESVFIDMARVAAVAGVSEESASKELMEAGAVFLTPEGTYDVSDVYLSGNVRRKLREAEAAAEAGMNMERNIEALKLVIPADVPYFNIEAKLGATWVPPEYYKQFIENMLGTKSDGIEVRFVVNRWKVRFNDRQLYNRSEAQTTWGTPWIHFDKLIAHAMGNMAVKIWGKDADGNKVINEEASAKANEKANKIREEFGNWLWADPVRKIEMERAYNEVMNAIAIPSFDGSFMTFEGMALQRGNSPFDMRSHQGNAVYRGLVNRRGIYAHEVGTGKTYTMGALAVESRRYGIAKKPLIFAHNANSSSVAREIGEQYPGAKVLYIDNLAPDRIDVTMRQIANDEWDAIVVPHSLISRFALKEETLMEISRHEIEALEQEAIDAANDDGIALTVDMMNDEDAMKKVRSHTAKQLVHGRNQIIKKVKEMALKSSKEGAVSFEDMGIDMIIVDEAHEFKKPPLATRMSMKGLNKTASNQSISLMFLADYVKKLNGGTGVHVFTGTPITNTINEIYNMMRFVMDDQMSRDGVREWDAWFNTFADQTSDVELTPAGEYEPVSRLAAFVNVPELRRMAGQYMDIVFADDMPEFKPRVAKSGKTLASDNLTDGERNELLNGRTEDPIGRPYKKIINDVAEMSPEQLVIFDELKRRAASFKAATKKERKEIMLSGDNRNPVIVETAAANAGLDARLYDIESKDSPESKVSRVVKNVLSHYNEHDLATQVIFVDKGYTSESVSRKKDRATGQVTVTKKPRFNLVRDIVAKLTEQGIPLNQIAIVDGSVSKEKRKEIADAMNLSKIRVVIGQTDTLGVGVNMQVNLRAMHHLDAPWMPGELEQRNGRGHRQGNKWNTVLEYRYITERIDGRRWQVLSIKERFIKSFLKADDSVRVIEGDAVSLDEDGDLGNTLSDAAGDPRLLLMNKLRADVQKLENRERMHAQGIFDAKREIGNLKDKIERVGKALANYRKDSEKFRAVAKNDLVVEVGGRKLADAEKANEAMELAASKIKVGEDPIEVAKIWGFTITAAQPVSWRGIEYQINGSAMHQMGKPTIESARATMYGVAKRAEGMEADIAEWSDSIPRMEEATKAPFARAKDLEKKRTMLADIEVDIQRNPVPAPSWLRNGAPAGTEVFVDGKPLTVEGHRYTSDGYYITVSDGDATRDIDYTEAKDENGLPKYEEREFEAPKILKADDKANGSANFNASVRPLGNPLDAATLEATIARVIAGSPSQFRRDTVVSAPLFADMPAPILEKAKKEGYDANGRKPNGEKLTGATYDGKVYLIQENISSELEAEETLLHERIHQIVHGNAKDPDGIALRQSLGRLYLRLGAKSGIERMATEAGINIDGPLAALPSIAATNRTAFLAEEFLAHAEGQRAYENLPEKIQRAIREFYGQFRDWLRGSKFVRVAEALGANLGDFTQSDLAWTLKGIRQQEAGAGSKAIRFMAAPYGTAQQQQIPGTAAPIVPPPPTRQMPAPLQGGAPGNNASWNALPDTKLDDVIRVLQDKHIDSKRTVQAIKAAGRQVADKWNVYEQETKFHGRAAKRTLEFVETELTPLARDLAMRGLTLAELEEYLHARHAPEANALIAQRNPAIPDGGSGMTNQQAAGYFANLDPSKRRRLAASAARVDAIIAGTRQAYVSYGLESQDTINGWAATFQHYVPLMREDKDGAMGIGQGFSIKGKESKSRTGSTRAVVDILANIAMQRERAITRGEKNRVSVSLLGLAKLNPNPDFWTVDRVPMIVGLNPATGLVESHPDPNYKNRKNVVVAKVPDGKGGVQERAVIFNEDSEPAMNMALALKNLDVAHLEGFMGAAATVTRYFASINTQYNPVFGVANLFRDTQEAMLNLGSTPIAGRQADVLKHTLGALRGIYIDTRQMRKGQPALSSYAQLWEEFQHEGGQTGYREMFRTSADRAHAIERAINPYRWMDSTLGQIFTAAGMLKVPMKVAQDKAGWLFDWLSDYNEAMENAVRLSAYKVGIDNGMSKHQAIVMAKGLTVNFNRKGQIAQQAGALYAFFNAAVQGTGRLTQTLFTMQGNDIKTARLSRLGVKIVAGGILWGSLQALMLMAAGFGEDDPPEFVREKNTIIPWKAATLGLVDTKQYTTIPMPLGFAIFPNIGRLATEFVMGGFKNPGKYMVKILGIMADAFNPIGGNGTVLQMVTPTALDPLAALSENKDWTKKPIAKVSYDKTKPGFTLWKDTASTPSKMIAEAINSLSGGTKYVAGKLSPTPDQIDYLFGQVTGGVGRELGKLEQSVVAAATGDELPPHKIPLVGRFYGNSDASSSQGTTFYNTIQRMNEHEATIKGLRKDGKGAEAAQYIADNPEARLVMRANHVERQVQKMRKEKHDLIEKGATRERVKAVEERIKIDMRRFNEAIEALKKRQKEAA